MGGVGLAAQLLITERFRQELYGAAFHPLARSSGRRHEL
jgi:hypothetical protein